jgi:hypothetical protein
LGKASLDALGISNGIRLEASGSPLEQILEEMESGDYDLTVIGAPSPKCINATGGPISPPRSSTAPPARC